VIRSHHKNSTLLEMVLTEGQNREIRRLLAKMGHKVLRLVRIAIGPVKLGKLPPAAFVLEPRRTPRPPRRLAPHGSQEMSPLQHAPVYADHIGHEKVAVVKNVPLARDTHRIRFESPLLARRIVPGQFIMMRLAGCNDPLLGRPLASTT